MSTTKKPAKVAGKTSTRALNKNQPKSKPDTIKNKTKAATARHAADQGQSAAKANSKSKTASTGTGSGRGGARPGAGRPKGSHSKKTQALLEKIMETGQTPLEFLIQQMRNTKAPMPARLQAARDAAPYVHSKMQTIELSGPGGEPIEVAKIPVDPAEAMAAYKDIMG
jgi:hypothetical protein